jgi:hypothetical protein
MLLATQLETGVAILRLSSISISDPIRRNKGRVSDVPYWLTNPAGEHPAANPSCVCGDEKPIPKLSDLTVGPGIIIGLTPSRWVARLQCLTKDPSQMHEREALAT